jgi:GH24 family phage-related lysozyme (muramidase)
VAVVKVGAEIRASAKENMPAWAYNMIWGWAGDSAIGGKSNGNPTKVVAAAQKWVGQDFKPGQSARCADWVREVLSAAGVDIGVAKGSGGPLMADSFHGGELGEIILDPEQLQPGDIVMFANTYDGPGRSPILGRGKITHVGIYVGNGEMVDRSTMSAPVRQRPISTFKFHSALRPSAYKSEVGGEAKDAIQLIKGFEGFHPTPYWDYAQYSWGYGTKAPVPDATIDKAQAEQELKAYLDKNCLPLIEPMELAPNQESALASLCYNLGPVQFQQSEAFLYASQGDHDAAADSFMRWTKAGGQVLPGLVTRREKEKAVYKGV